MRLGAADCVSGRSGPLAEIYADRIDWHQVARLVVCDCPPRLTPAHRPLTSAVSTLVREITGTR